MKPVIAGGVMPAAIAAVVAGLGAGVPIDTASAQAPQKAGREVLKFEVDPSWPKLPAKWVFGQASSVSIDESWHAWVLQWPGHAR